MAIVKQCAVCGKVFSVGGSGPKADGRKTCSAECKRLRQVANFWNNVDRSGGPDACWPWLLSRKVTGYGQAYLDGRQHKAHRLAWVKTNGAIAHGESVLHRCDNPPCCNPAHLFLGTQQDNMADMIRKGRRATSVVEFCSGSEHPMALLSEVDVVRIRRLVASGAVQRRIAAQYGVSCATVNLIVKRKTWRHVP